MGITLSSIAQSFCLFIEPISSSSISNNTHKQPTFPIQTNQQKKTNTYGVVWWGTPLRQGRSLWLPTLPYQQANRYAVVDAMLLTCT
jgi:hypothetical protein